MSDSPKGKQANVTQLLHAWETGDRAALEELTPRVCVELHRMARNYMRKEQSGNTMQATALVNEAFLRLVDVKNVEWQERARAKEMGKRGNTAQHINFDEVPELASRPTNQSLVAVDDALQQLERVDPRTAQVVELKFFSGLSVEETDEVLKVSPQTVMLDWKMARAWLMTEQATNEPLELFDVDLPNQVPAYGARVGRKRTC